ncbi:histone acetyltransferase 1 [Pyricularia grisea]|nr:histone acetyltransferase 1 [Pyricularia grisea]
MAESDLWSVDANSALELSLVEPTEHGLTTVTRFHPRFTYPLFGEEEQIFGYQDLKINLQYHAPDMRPNVKITHSKKFKSIGETQPTDLDALLQEYLPPVAFAKNREFQDAIRLMPADWTPPGEILSEFDGADGAKFEIRRSSLADDATRQIIDRVQLLILLFIEGGSYIGTDTNDSLDRWDIFFLYNKKPSKTDGTSRYQFAGYSTVYKFFPLQRFPLEPKEARENLELPSGEFPFSNLRSRTRISQFLILPPFQKSGNGSRLYRTIYEYCLRDPNVIEVTVEDPNEAFDDMRDVADLDFLRQKTEFTDLKINTEIHIPRQGAAPRGIVDEIKSEEVRCLYRIAPRQFSRVLEMHLMSRLAETVRPTLTDTKIVAKPTKAETHEYDLWKLFVKQRLYRHNKEVLSQLDRHDRIDRLNETLGSVELEYARILALAERRSQATTSNLKRKLENVKNEEGSASKKARVEDA